MIRGFKNQRIKKERVQWFVLLSFFSHLETRNVSLSLSVSNALRWLIYSPLHIICYDKCQFCNSYRYWKTLHVLQKGICVIGILLHDILLFMFRWGHHKLQLVVPPPFPLYNDFIVPYYVRRQHQRLPSRFKSQQRGDLFEQ